MSDQKLEQITALQHSSKHHYLFLQYVLPLPCMKPLNVPLTRALIWGSHSAAITFNVSGICSVWPLCCSLPWHDVSSITQSFLLLHPLANIWWIVHVKSGKWKVYVYRLYFTAATLFFMFKIKDQSIFSHSHHVLLGYETGYYILISIAA